MDEREKDSRRAMVAALAVLATAFGKEMPDEQIDIYITSLCDLSPDQIERAVKFVIAEERFFPAIATIRNAAVNDASRLSPEEAWGFICQRIQRQGRSAGVRGLSPEIVSGVGSGGGWMALCQSENPVGDRITFVRAYTSFIKREQQGEAAQWHGPEGLRSAIAGIGRGKL